MTELEKIEYAKNWQPTVEQAISLAVMSVEAPEFIFIKDPEPVKIPLADGYKKALQVLAQAYKENIEEAFEIRDGVRSVYERLQDEQLVNSIIDLPRKDQKALLKRIKEMRKEKTE